MHFWVRTVSLFSCHVDRNVFHHWVINDLLPKAPTASIIVMDNATFHKRTDTKRPEQHIQYLPSYSLDLHPIEHKWAQAKSIRRKL